MRVLTLLVLLGLAACQQAAPPPVAAQDDPMLNPRGVRADDVVTMAPESYGCDDQERFGQAIYRDLRREHALWSEVLGYGPACFYGRDLKPGQEFTVLTVEGALMLVAQRTVSQRASDPDRFGHRYWTSTRWGLPQS